MHKRFVKISYMKIKLRIFKRLCCYGILAANTKIGQSMLEELTAARNILISVPNFPEILFQNVTDRIYFSIATQRYISADVNIAFSI